MTGCKDCRQYDKRIKQLKQEYTLLKRRLKKTSIEEGVRLREKSRFKAMILSIIKRWANL